MYKMSANWDMIQLHESEVSHPSFRKAFIVLRINLAIP